MFILFVFVPIYNCFMPEIGRRLCTNILNLIVYRWIFWDILSFVYIKVYSNMLFLWNLSPSRNSCPVKMGPIRCPETSVNSYHTTPRNTPKDLRFHHRGGSLKSMLFFSLRGFLFVFLKKWCKWPFFQPCFLLLSAEFVWFSIVKFCVICSSEYTILFI